MMEKRICMNCSLFKQPYELCCKNITLKPKKESDSCGDWKSLKEFENYKKYGDYR